MDQRGAADEDRLRRRDAQERGPGLYEVGRAAGVSCEVRAAQVGEVADCLEPEIELLVGERRPFERLRLDHLVEGVVVDTVEQCFRIAAHRGDDLRVEVRAAARTDHLHRIVDTRDAVEHFARFRDLRDPSSQREFLTRELTGHTFSVPAGVRLFDPGANVVAQSQSVGELAGGRAMVGHLLHHAPAAGCHQLRGLAHPVERRGSRARPSEHEHHRRESGQVDLDRVGAEVDVVAEHRRRFVAVHGTTHVGEDADVVQLGEIGWVEPEPVADPHADPGRSQHVFRRLPEAEVGRKRQRHQQLAESHARVAHAGDFTTRGVNAS